MHFRPAVILLLPLAALIFSFTLNGAFWNTKSHDIKTERINTRGSNFLWFLTCLKLQNHPWIVLPYSNRCNDIYTAMNLFTKIDTRGIKTYLVYNEIKASEDHLSSLRNWKFIYSVLTELSILSAVFALAGHKYFKASIHCKLFHPNNLV